MKLPKYVFIFIAMGLIVAAPTLFARGGTVNCDKGDSLQKAIESAAGSAAPLNINLLGTCHENFDFSRDRVNIVGDGDTTIVGSIRMFASDDVNFADLKITGPGWGFSVFNGRVRFTRVNVFANDGAGVYGRHGATLIFRDSQIIDNHGESGVFLENSELILINSQVSLNWSYGILASRNSTVSLRNTEVHANQAGGIHAKMSSTVEALGSHIWENGNVGIFMRTGSSGEIHDSAVNANQTQGLEVSGNSTLDVFGGEVSWNGVHGAWVSEHSFLRLIDAQVGNNIGHGVVIGRDGGVILEGGSGVQDNTEFFQVVCQGKEASIDIVPPASAGPLDCVDPDF